MLKVVEEWDEREAGVEVLLLGEIARASARRMLIEALGAEADDYVERHRPVRATSRGTPASSRGVLQQ